MTNPGSPQENAITERVNGILKEEWLHDADFSNIKEAHKTIRDVIKIYNTYRPHKSLNNEVPENIHDMGFSRQETERVIGKMYEYAKGIPMGTPNSSNTLTGNDYSSYSCSPAELYSLHRCKTKMIK